MDIEQKIVKVNIFGSEYTLRASSNDNGEIYKVAEFVDRKMKEIQSLKPNRPLHQIAILSALNIAVELFQERDKDNKDFVDFQSKVKELADKLELGILDKTEENAHIN